MLSEFGPALTLPHSRKIAGTEDLFELRIQVATNICRLSGFIKKQDKTDPNEIGKALKIRRRYIDEKENRSGHDIISEDKNNEGK
jgi:hypothetical protein